MTINITGSEDAWQRQCLITVDDGTNGFNWHALTETVDIDMGERDLDKIDLMNLGQIPKHGAIGITTVTFEGYAMEAGTHGSGDSSPPCGAAATGFWDVFADVPKKDTSEPQAVAISNTLTRYRVAILWTNDVAATGGDDDVAEASLGKRFIIADCFCTSHKISMTDGIVKTTATFKGVAFNKAGAARIRMDSSDATAAGLVLGVYVPGDTDPFVGD